MIQERDTNSTPTVAYTRGSDLSGSLEGAGGIGGLLARTRYLSGSPTSSYFYFADGNGNVTYMIDTNQAMVASYRYDPFGKTISSSGSLASANVYRFSSKEIHAATGMYYYGYRFYDPNLQRWINRDPTASRINSRPPRSGLRILRHALPRRAVPRDYGRLQLRDSANLYAFNRNAPVYSIDAKGLMTQQQILLNLQEANEENDYAAIQYWQAELNAYSENAAAIAEGDAAALQAEAVTAEVTAAAEGTPLWVKCGMGAWAAVTGYAIGTEVANADAGDGGTVSDSWGEQLGDLCPGCWNWVFWKP